MKRFLRKSAGWLSLAGALCLIGSCASVPYWYRHVPTALTRFYGTGSAELKSAEKSRNIAMMRAREAIAAQVRSTLQESVSDYYQENEKAKNSQAIAFVESMVRQVVDLELKYTKVEKVEIGRDGVTYALLSLRNSDLRKALKEKKEAMQAQGNPPAEGAPGAAPAVSPQAAEEGQRVLQFYIRELEAKEKAAGKNG